MQKDVERSEVFLRLCTTLTLDRDSLRTSLWLLFLVRTAEPHGHTGRKILAGDEVAALVDIVVNIVALMHCCLHRSVALSAGSRTTVVGRQDETHSIDHRTDAEIVDGETYREETRGEILSEELS